MDSFFNHSYFFFFLLYLKFWFDGQLPHIVLDWQLCLGGRGDGIEAGGVSLGRQAWETQTGQSSLDLASMASLRLHHAHGMLGTRIETPTRDLRSPESWKVLGAGIWSHTLSPCRARNSSGHSHPGPWTGGPGSLCVPTVTMPQG